MKLCIAGKNNIAVDVLLYAIKYIDKEDIYIIVNRNDLFKNTWQKSLGFYAKINGINIVELEDVYSISNLVFLSLEFDRIIKPERFKTTRLYNIHFSLLPEFKGLYTSILPILYDKSYTGVTFHKIDQGIDTGDIIFQKRIRVKDNESSRSLYFKYLKTGTKLIIDNFSKIVDGEFTCYKQSSKNSTYYNSKSFDIRNNRINTSQTAHQIKRNVQAFLFREYQLPVINNILVNNIEILSAKSTMKPGVVVADNEASMILATVDYDILVTKDYYFELLKFCQGNDYDAAIKIINFVKNLDETDVNGWTPLMIACYNGAKDIVNLLINKGANINKTNINGTTPLMYAKDYAINSGNMEIIRLLIENGANVYLKDIYYKTVIDYLNDNSQMEILNSIEKLVKK